MSTPRSMGLMRIVAIVAYIILVGSAAWKFMDYAQSICWKEWGWLDISVWLAVGALLVLFGLNSQLSDLHSDLRSFLVVASGVQSDIYSALSDFQSDFQSRVPKRVATDSQLSDLHSDLSARIPTTLSSGRMRTDVEAIGANTTAATNLRQAVIGAVTGAAVAGTLSTTQCTTNLTIDNSDMNGRLLTFLTGPNPQVQTEITASASAGGLLTFTAIPQAVVAGDTFVIT